MSSYPDIAIVIPAAGASIRMGTPKQLLPWGTTTLLGHAIAEALQSGAKMVTVVLGAHAAMIEKEVIQYSDASIITNKDWEKGIGNSIAYGVRHVLDSAIPVEGILVMLPDYPLITHHYLHNFINRFQEEKKRNILATSYGKNAGAPAIFGKAYFDALAQLNDDFGARDLIEQNIDDTITLDLGKILLDIDTKEEYNRIYKKRL